MTLQELLRITCDHVTIYRETGEAEYTDIYNGKLSEIPADLLNKEIKVFGAKNKNMLDIEIIM